MEEINNYSFMPKYWDCFEKDKCNWETLTLGTVKSDIDEIVILNMPGLKCIPFQLLRNKLLFNVEHEHFLRSQLRTTTICQLRTSVAKKADMTDLHSKMRCSWHPQGPLRIISLILPSTREFTLKFVIFYI